MAEISAHSLHTTIKQWVTEAETKQHRVFYESVIDYDYCWIAFKPHTDGFLSLTLCVDDVFFVLPHKKHHIMVIVDQLTNEQLCRIHSIFRQRIM